MEKVKKERKPRQPKADKPRVSKPKVDKPKVSKAKAVKPKVSKPKTYKPSKNIIKLENALMGGHSIQNEEWFKPSFQKDIQIVAKELSAKIKKVQDNTKVSAEEKQKKINKHTATNTKILLDLAKDYTANPEFYKKMAKK